MKRANPSMPAQMPAMLADASGWQLDWAHGSAQVQALGGMLGPVDFRLADGRRFQPFYVAPWQPDPALPGLLQRMRGEWPCVPFTRNRTPESIPPGWQALPDTAPQRSDAIHGHCSNQRWRLIEAEPGRLLLGFADYPAESPIASLRREIRADPDAPRLWLSLDILPRCDVTLPLALHPTFRLPDAAGQLHLQLPHYRSVHTYPFAFEPCSRLPADVSAARLNAMPAAGGTLDLSRLPLAEPTEELVQVKDVAGSALLDYLDEGVRVALDWDAHALPDLVLWLSNGGRTQAPWLGRNRALGVEPVNGVFELGGVMQPLPGHPLAARKGVALRKGIPLQIKYSIGVAKIPA
ncbi:hypothetical protein [Chitinilyticum litopenaei]|uniref:hypothetical protein n=1 Tax=Chitinilyticum litopenaei TaxID=1121276 RepID=UPI00040378FE|nr:hypothetical protein [Chitinilyticum litopenaei]